MSHIPFDKDVFLAALTRQWQHFGLTASNQMTEHQWWQAVSAAIAEQLSALPQPKAVAKSELRHVNYLSMEFLIGRLTANNLINLGWYDAVEKLSQRMTFCSAIYWSKKPIPRWATAA